MDETSGRRVLVTGASAGIGAATARRLAAEGWSVVAVARREERLAALAAATGIEVRVCDVTSAADVAELAAHLAATGGVDAVVNNAGGALGLEPIAETDVELWRRMYDVNVLGTLRITQAVLPMLRERGGDVVVITSTAALAPYPGGAGYTGVKHAQRMLAETLRWELVGEPIRVIDIAPGAVETEFATVRFAGDVERAAQVYAGYTPLTADDIADTISWSLSRPPHVNIDRIVVRPRAQANNTTIARSQD
ncbi:SDR family oxidoreductase [Isoptericola sp. b441]|uniref:SDR family oxidoreductase n=1 Tax=Actinotalea lenta TaxID=3064654 RepID=A0ABT9D8S0_9CELL|nr:MULTISPECIES: SDR family oxidoreductase [unclassified Isoptericola]MDO8107294.1 SDR family oxidoreductase [Isoptericola sp. b441]MDO8121044.1 SDR family oxidoreductase [Isoptericola sp. b490]